MSTKKPESKQKEPVYCIRCRMLANEMFCIHGEVTAKDPIEPGKAQWARNVNANNDCPYFEPIPKPKVYCDQCGNFRDYRDRIIRNRFGFPEKGGAPECHAQENMKDSYITAASKPGRMPSELNANNDCPWFKPFPVIRALAEPIHVTNVSREQANCLAKAAVAYGAALLSKIVPKRPWWKFWQRKEV